MGIGDFFQAIWDFISHDIYIVLEEFGIWCLAKLVVWWFEMKIKTMLLTFTVCSSVIADLNLSATINQAFGSIDSRLLYVSTYARMPEAINAIMSALLTKFVMRFVGL